MMAIIGGAHAHHTRDGAGVLGSVKGALPSVAATPPLTPPARARQRVARVMGIRMLRRGFRAPDGHRVVGVISCAKSANNLVDNMSSEDWLTFEAKPPAPTRDGVVIAPIFPNPSALAEQELRRRERDIGDRDPDLRHPRIEGA
jgi:hypothetical protein